MSLFKFATPNKKKEYIWECGHFSCPLCWLLIRSARCHGSWNYDVRVPNWTEVFESPFPWCFWCSSGAEPSPHHRNNGQPGHFYPYIWGWI